MLFYKAIFFEVTPSTLLVAWNHWSSRTSDAFFFRQQFSLAMDVLQIRGTARFLAEENGAFKQTVADTWEMSRHALFLTGWLVLW